MLVAVRYQSRGGNTRAMAERIAAALAVVAEPVGSPNGERIELLFLGGGVYAGGLDRAFKSYLETLRAGDIGQIVPFSTAAYSRKAIRAIRKYAQKAGIPVSESELCLKLGFRQTGGHLREEALARVAEFAASFAKSDKISGK